MVNPHPLILMANSKPKVFISYAYSSNEYTLKVSRLVERLFSDGVEALFDQYELKPGKSLEGYTERCLDDKELTKVVILLNPSYKKKADSRGKSLIGTRVLSKEMYEKLDKTKVIPVLFDKMGGNEKECLPSYLKDSPRLDLSEENRFESSYLALVRAIYDKNPFVKPTLGERPAWLEDKEGLVYDPGAIARIKDLIASKDKRLRRTAGEFLRVEIESVPYGAMKIATPEEFKLSYHLFKRLRYQYLAILDELLEASFLEDLLREFFEKLDAKILPPAPENKGRNACVRILKHELIIETISILYENYRFELIGKLIGGTYVSGFDCKCKDFRGYFYSRDDYDVLALDLLLAKDYSKDGRKPFSGVGAYWIRHLPSLFLDRSAFSFADVLIFNLSVKEGYKPWFPVAYVYSLGGDRRLKMLAARLRSAELAKKYLPLFECVSLEGLKKKLTLIQEFALEQGTWRGYKGCAYEVDALSKYLKPKDIGEVA